MAMHENETGTTGMSNTRVDLDTNKLNDVLGNSMPKTNRNDNAAAPILTFGAKPITTMNSGLGSEYLNKLLEQVKEIYAGENIGAYKLNVLAIDNEVVTNLQYSCLVTSLCKNKKVTYFITMLEGTGRRPLDATAIIAEQNNMLRMNNVNKSTEVFVTSDAVDTILDNEVVKQLTSVHGSDNTFITVDALVIPYNNTDLSAANIRPIASIALNACRVQSGKINNEFRDLNIAAAKAALPNSFLKIDSNMLPSTIIDATGRQVRADFQIELHSVDNRNVSQSINLQNTKNVISKSAGFVDAMPVEIPVHSMPGMAQSSMLRLRPHVILTTMEADMPTTGYALLSLVTSVVMTRPAMWLAAVAPKSTDELHDAGKLNMITNLENNQNGIGEPVDLKDPTLAAQEVHSLLKQMYSLEAMFSLDVETCGTQSDYLSIFAAASAPGTSKDESTEKYNAAKEIISAANWLADGMFPQDFDINNIFLNSGIVIPTGKWTDKNGTERDLRDIDLSFVANVGQNTELVNQWALSNVPHAISGMDPYLTKVEIISKLVPNAEITGKATRCTFTPDFITTLSTACANAGLETRYDPEVNYSEQSNIAVLGNYLANAGIAQDATSFARTFTNGNNYQTPYAMQQHGNRQW